MAVSSRFILQQGPALGALGRTALSALRPASGRGKPLPDLPGKALTATLPPRTPALISAYVRNVGGDPSAYKGTLPGHLFPQWGFGLAARCLTELPYPLMKVVNGGCRIETRTPLPAGEELNVSARLEEVDDDGRRAVLRTRIVTGTASAPEALIADLYAIVPLGGGSKGGPKPKKDKPSVPAGAREIGRWHLPANAGLDFAKLTGDFNPIHWIPAYARASGFKSTILHGFGTMARAIEGLNRSLFAGSASAIELFDCKFTSPLVLPAKPGLYVDDEGGVFVGDAPGGPAYLTGSYTVRAQETSDE